MAKAKNMLSLPNDDASDDKLWKNAIRRAFSRSKLRKRAGEKAKSDTIFGPKGGARWICTECGEPFPPTQCEVDHDDPVTPVDVEAKDQSVEDYYDRVRCDESNLRVLCKECHRAKSKAENAERRRIKKEKKDEKK